jgi:hypothetical protein
VAVGVELVEMVQQGLAEQVLRRFLLVAADIDLGLDDRDGRR